MKKKLKLIFSISVIALLLSTIAFAQGSRNVNVGANKYMISAEAGGVNYVEGRVMVVRGNETSGYLLKGDSIKIGDEIETGVDGKTEILLNPGSYARLGGNSSFEFVDTSLEDLQLKLNHGSAMFEVITTDDFSFTVETPKGSFSIVKSGVYRIDVLKDGTGKIEVWKGRAKIDDVEDSKIKKGRTATVDGDDFAIAKFDRGDRDGLEQWSRDRSKQLAKINSGFERDRLRRSMISSFGMNHWNLYDSFGVWVFDPFWGAYTFLPFGSSWSSPYGYRYRRDLWYCRLPRYIYRQPPPVRNTKRNTNVNRKDMGASRSINSKVNRPQRTSPPFRQIERKERRIKPNRRTVQPRQTPGIIVPRRTVPMSKPDQKGKGN